MVDSPHRLARTIVSPASWMSVAASLARRALARATNATSRERRTRSMRARSAARMASLALSAAFARRMATAERQRRWTA